MTLGPLAPLAAYHQFILYRAVPRPTGKTDKLPLDPRTLQPGSAHDPSNHLTYDSAVALAAQQGLEVGFVLTAADPFWVLDIDHCRTPEGWSPLVAELLPLLPGAVVEVSRSGQGLHVWGRSRALPPHRSRDTQRGLEFYSNERFIALGHAAQATGVLAEDCPGVATLIERYFPPLPAADTPAAGDGPRADWNGPTDDNELIRRACAAQSAGQVFGGGVSFFDLWTRNADAMARKWPAEGGYDESSADAALASHLAFWTGCDAGRMDALMRASGLAREKYERPDYLPRTIQAAIGLCTTVCKDKPVALPAGPALQASPASPASPAAPAAAPSAPVRVEGSTFLNADQQQALFAGCVYVVDQHRVLVPGGQLLKPDQFKARYGGFTFLLDNRNEKTSRDAWEAFTQSQALRWPRADGTVFLPREPYGTLHERGGLTLANLWWPVRIPRRKGDVEPFLRHIRLMFPDPRDQAVALAYLAGVVQNQGVKSQWAIVITGVEGNGKTLLSACAAFAVGDRYVHWPSADKIDKQFNGWLYGKVLYCVEDIHTCDFEKLKPMITSSRGYEIEKKGVDQFSAFICGNFIFNSNHKDAVRKTRNDRRLAILYCAQQNVDDLERDGMAGDYVKDIYDWLETGGFEAVAEFLHTYPIPDTLNFATGCPRAPRTSATDEAIAVSLGPAEQEVLEAIGQERTGFRGDWVSGRALDALLREIRREQAIPPNKRRAFMQGLGFDWHPVLNEGRTDNPVLPDGYKVKLYVRKGSPAAALSTRAEVAAAYSAAQGLTSSPS